MAGVMKTVYIVGSLRNPQIPIIGNALRSWGYEAFDDWWSASEDADEWWQKHERMKGRTYQEAINGWHAKNVHAFDKYHIDRSDAGLLVMPAGRSGHLEIGHMSGQGKPCYVLFDKEPERFDIMFRLCSGGVHFDLTTLHAALKKDLG